MTARTAPSTTPFAVGMKVVVKCNRCGREVEMQADRAGWFKVAHQHTYHYGHPWDFSVKQAPSK